MDMNATIGTAARATPKVPSNVDRVLRKERAGAIDGPQDR